MRKCNATSVIFIIDESLNRLAQFNQLVRAEERAVIEITLLAEGVDLIRSKGGLLVFKAIVVFAIRSGKSMVAG